MSINIVVGSDPADTDKIKQTIDILKLVNNLANKEDISTIDTESLDDLVDWYNSMYNILTDPTIFSESN
jgi:hypothetical protein